MYKKNVETIKYLVGKNPDFVNAKDKKGLNGLVYACANNTNLSIIKYLTDLPCIQIHFDFMNILQHACADNPKIIIIEYLAKKYPSLIKETTKNGDTLLHYAALNSSVDVVKYVTETLNFNAQSENNYNQTPFWYACLNIKKNKCVIEYLASKSKEILNQPDDYGVTLLHCACLKKNNLEIIRYLIEDLKLDISLKNKEEKTIFHAMSINKNTDPEIVKYLAKKCEKFIHCKDKLGNTALHYACASTNDINIIKYLIETFGFDALEIKNNDEETPLDFARKVTDNIVFNFINKFISYKNEFFLQLYGLFPSNIKLKKQRYNFLFRDNDCIIENNHLYFYIKNNNEIEEIWYATKLDDKLIESPLLDTEIENDHLSRDNLNEIGDAIKKMCFSSISNDLYLEIISIALNRGHLPCTPPKRSTLMHF